MEVTLKKLAVSLLFAVLLLPINGWCLTDLSQDTARVGVVGDFLRLETKAKIMYIKKDIIKSVTLSRIGENVVILIVTDEMGMAKEVKGDKMVGASVSKTHTMLLKEASLAKDTLNRIMKLVTFKPEPKPEKGFSFDD